MKPDIMLKKGKQKVQSLAGQLVDRIQYGFLYQGSSLTSGLLPKKFFRAEPSDDIARAYREAFPGHESHKLAQADGFCAHIFDLLGSGPTQLDSARHGSDSIDWHCDFKSGYRWDERSFYADIPYAHKEGVDIKVPWELSRFQHLTRLGQASFLSGDTRYSDEFVSEITDWIAHNRVGHGVNWVCPMDVAIRAVNWLVAAEYFESGSFSPAFLLEFNASLYEHGQFIRSHLENKTEFSGNHYLADLAGLFFIAHYCPDFRESAEWAEFARTELILEMERQVYEDGCSFEASTSYHRLALEIFFYCEVLAQKIDTPFPDAYQKKLRKMFEFSLHCIKPNGRIPQIGDNDNGRFLKFAERDVLDHRYLLSLAAVHYRSSDFKLPHSGFDEEVFWVFGEQSKKIWSDLPYRTRPLASRSFTEAGWFILRHGSDYCFVSCGPNGLNGKGAHAHNDKLSFELCVDGEDIVVDPGSYSYTAFPRHRNEFRLTHTHNTLQIGGVEQNRIPDTDLFSLADDVAIPEVHLEENGAFIKFHGRIQYGKNEHKRQIVFNKKTREWCITDTFSSSWASEAKARFHFSPLIALDEGNLGIRSTQQPLMRVEADETDRNEFVYDYSPEYGLKQEALGLEVTIKMLNGTGEWTMSFRPTASISRLAKKEKQ